MQKTCVAALSSIEPVLRFRRARTAGAVALCSVVFLAGLSGCEQSNSPDQVNSPASGDRTVSDESGSQGGGSIGGSETGSGSVDGGSSGGDGESITADGVSTDSTRYPEPIPASDVPLTAERVYAGNVSFGIPEGWSSRPASNQFRVAELAGPRAGDAPSAVAAFSLAGGSIDANIDRWASQFAEADALRARAKTEFAGFTVHLVEMGGSYRGMGGPSQEGTAMLAAIVEQPGQPSVFVKMTGPEASIDAARGGWNAMIQSLSSP